jgi:hypothetical protein
MVITSGLPAANISAITQSLNGTSAMTDGTSWNQTATTHYNKPKITVTYLSEGSVNRAPKHMGSGSNGGGVATCAIMVISAILLGW